MGDVNNGGVFISRRRGLCEILVSSGEKKNTTPEKSERYVEQNTETSLKVLILAKSENLNIRIIYGEWVGKKGLMSPYC